MPQVSESNSLRPLGRARADLVEDSILFEEEESQLRATQSRPTLESSFWSLSGCISLVALLSPARLRSPHRKRAPVKSYICRFLLLLGVSFFAIALTAKRGDVKERVVVWLTPGRPSSSFHNVDSYVKSSPTLRFRDNLVDGVKYTTAWPIEGFTNQYIAQVNLLYLASLAGRIPVLPSFRPSHMAGKSDPGPLPVSEVFDIQKLRQDLQRPILEWKDIKSTSSREVEDIGCWSVFKTSFKKESHFGSEEELALDVSLTKVPDSARFSSQEFHTNIMSLASLSWHETRVEALRNTKPIPSLQHHHTMQPDNVMLCYDNLYYVGAASPYEWERVWSPSWNLVGKYMRWNPRLEELARACVLRAFGLTVADQFPSYISVHVRRTDFKSGCYSKPVESCFAPLAVYAERVEELKAEIWTTRGIVVNNVLMASDETNQTWWDDVRELGWSRLDHNVEKTEQTYESQWYPVLLDSVALSLAKGLVGTKGSTLSLVAGKRVQFWEDGPVRQVALGIY